VHGVISHEARQETSKRCYWCSLSIENNMAVKRAGHKDEGDGVWDVGVVRSTLQLRNLNWLRTDWLIYVRIWTVSHRLRSTLTNWHRFAALSLLALAVTYPSTNRARRNFISVAESPSKHWSPPRTYQKLELSKGVSKLDGTFLICPCWEEFAE